MKPTDSLKLDKQVCFPIYATSRLIMRMYQPLLDRLGITYTQYLVMMVLWQEDGLKITDIGKKLYLNTNTLTPLIMKLIKKELLVKQRSEEDERTVIVSLTETGRAMKEKAEYIPFAMAESVDISDEELTAVRKIMCKFLNHLTNRVEGCKRLGTGDNNINC